MPELPRSHCRLPWKQEFKLKGVKDSRRKQNMQFCHLLLFLLLFFCSKFLLLRYAGFPFFFFLSFVKSYPVIMIQQDKTKPKQNQKPLILHSSCKKLLLSAILIGNRSASSKSGFFPGTDACKCSCVIVH